MIAYETRSRRGRSAVAAWCGACLLAAVLPGAAQQSAPPAAAPATGPQEKPESKKVSDLSIEELMDLKVDEVLAASRYVQKLADAPASVTIVTAEDIRRHGYRTLAEILKSIRGVYSTQDRSYSYVGVRGFGIPADYNNRVLFLVDGHRVNEAVYDWAGVGNEFILDVDTIERLEFIRGPASSLYGSSAFFAVISIMTKKGRRIDGVEVAGSAGSFGTQKGRVSVGRLFDGGLELLVTGTAGHSRGQKLYYPEFDAPATRNGFVSGADGELYYDLGGRLSYQGFTLQGAYNYRDKGVPTAYYNTVFGTRDTRTWDSLGYISLRYDHQFQNQVDVMARVHYNHGWYRGDYLYEDTSSGTPVPLLNRDRLESRWWGTEVLLTKHFADDAAKVSIGSELRHNFRQDLLNVDVEPRTVYLDSKRHSFLSAVFAQADARVLEELRLNAGLRYDYYDTFGGSLNPRAAIIVTPWEDTNFKLLYGRAFRAPSAAESFLEAPSSFKRNPDLGPETIDTYEIALEQRLGAGLQFIASTFYYECRDMITLLNDPADGVDYFDNVEKVRTMGAEFELRGKLSNGLEGSLSYSYQEAKFVATDSWLVNSPRHLAKLHLAVPLFAEGAFAGFELQYMGERKTFAGGSVEDFVVANLTFSFRNVVNNLDFSASVYNLFDVRYFDPGGAAHAQDRLQQDGINFRVGLTYRF